MGLCWEIGLKNAEKMVYLGRNIYKNGANVASNTNAKLRNLKWWKIT